MNKTLHTAMLLMLSFSSYILYAQETIELDYNKARQYALEQNAEVKNARLDVQISQKKVWETTAIGLPQVTTGVSYNNYIDIPVTLIPADFSNPDAGKVPVQFGTTHNGSLNLTASQLIFSGEYIVGLQAARTYKYLSQQSLDKAESDVIEAVSQSYHTLLFARENLRILQASKTEMDSTLREIKAVYAVGMTDETSVDQMQINLRTIENAIASTQRQISVQEQFLKIQMGMDPLQKLLIRDSLMQVYKASNVEQMMMQEFDINRNNDYRLMETQIALQELNLKREKSTYLPTLSGFYQHQESGQSNEFEFFDKDFDYYQANIVGLSLDWNLFTSGGRNAKVQQQKLELQKLQNTQQMLTRQLEMSVHQAKTELKTAYETYLKEEANMVLAKKIYDNAKVQFKSGTLTSTELTTLTNQYINSQGNYYAAVMTLLNQKVKLDNTLGNN